MASFRVVSSPCAHYLTAGSGASSTHSTDLDDPEEESIRLAIALQLEDLENAQRDDEAAVLEVYKSYLKDSERFFADRRLAEALAAGEDPRLVELMEEALEGDGKVTRKAGGEEVLEIDDDCDEDAGGNSDMELDEQMKLACELSLKMFEQEKLRNAEDKKPTASSSAETPPRPPPAPQPATRTCSGCMETFPTATLIIPPCTHPYCPDCLKQFFLNFIEDQSSLPRCCKLPIPLYLINRRLSRQELKRFRERVAEYTSKDRVYCSNPQCSAFLPATTNAKNRVGKAEVLTCKACKCGTCVRCMAPEHAGDCPEDSELTATLAVAAREGWQRCQSCHALVEKDFGCQHMSCRCGSEWCYRCAAKWKSCACGDFEVEGEVVPQRTVDDLIVKRVAVNEAELKRRRQEREGQRREAWERCGHGGKLSDKLRGRAKAREKGQKGTKKGKERAEGNVDATGGSSLKKRRVEDVGNVEAAAGAGAGGEEPWWGEEGLWKYKLGESRCDICEVVLKDYIWACEGCGLEACMACRENGL
ncbi:hypothetical protein EV426DRAFT_721987 [Tirmania nivea]|nr:hypothetical protein EV426DRAFT_721987 [Tirmania nivea]